MTMMLPPAPICRAAALEATKIARRFTATMRSKSARAYSSNKPVTTIPALLTRMSRRPNRTTATSIAVSSWPASSPSAQMATARPPAVATAVSTSAAPAAATVVVDQAKCRVPDVTLGGVRGIVRDGFAATRFGGLAIGAVVELAMQPRRRLIGDQLERMGGSAPASQPFAGLEPHRVAGAVRVAEASDGFGMDLYPARRGVQRTGLRIAPELPQPVGCGRRRQFQFPQSPESLEVGRRRVDGLQVVQGPLVEMLQPFLRAAPFTEGRFDPEAVGQPSEDRIVVAGLGGRRSRLVHGDHQRIMGRRADVVALERDRRGQDDVRMQGRPGPGLLVHDDGVGTREGLFQPKEILVMVEGVAARPVD